MQTLGEFFKKRALRTRYRVDELAARVLRGETPRRIVFVHVPKTAGTTVNGYFKSRFGSGSSGRVVLLDDLDRGEDWEARLARARAARFVGGHFGRETLDAIRGDAFVFTFLREPVARIRSFYRFTVAHRREDHRHDDAGIEAFLTDPQVRILIDNAQTGQLGAARDRPLPDDDAGRAALLASAKACLDSMDLVGLTEDFDAGFHALVDRLELDQPGRVERRNTTESHIAKSGVAPKSAALSDRAATLIEPLVALDRELYAHALQLRARPS